MWTMNWFAFLLMVDIISGLSFQPKMAEVVRPFILVMTTGYTVSTNIDFGLAAGVTGQQGMFSPPWHMIQPLASVRVIEPQEPIVLLNNFLEMNCTAKEISDLHASQLYWTASGVNVSEKSMKIIGEKTLQFRKNITSISEIGTYKCKINNRKRGDAVNLKVEYAAAPNVTSFMCLFEKGALTCNWTLDKCRYPEFIDIKLRMSLSNNNFKECPVDLDYTMNSCTWIITNKATSYQFHLFLRIENIYFGGKSNYSFMYKKDIGVTTPNVSSFMCMLQENTLSCNWTLEKVEFPEDVEVDLTIKIFALVTGIVFKTISFNIPMTSYTGMSSSEKSPDKNKTFHPCPVALSYTSNFCTWKIITPSYRFDFYLEVRSKLFGGKMTYSKLFYKSEILKLPPPVNINYKSNGTCVFLEWNVDRYYPSNTSLSVTSLTKPSVTQTRMLYKINKTVFCNLRPASSYIAIVQLIPVSGYHYSEQKRRKFNMPAIPPTEAPRVFPGGFFIDPDSKCNSANAKRTVYIYWQRISKSSENGKNISYEISYNGGSLTDISHDQSSTSIISVYCHVSYNVLIRARNEAGPSATSSLFLERHKDLTPPSKIIVEQIGDKRALLTWYRIDKQASQYVVWCRKNVNFECKDEIHYENWNNHTEITQDKVRSLISEVMFGITQVKNRTGSGIIWQTCTYDREKEPSKIENVEIVDSSSDNSLKVRWQPEPCALMSGNVFIILYRVFYCEVTITNECKARTNKTIETYPDERPEFTISGLKVGIRYGVSIQAASETKTGEISDMVIGVISSRTKMEDLELTEEELAGIVSGSVFVFIFFTAGFIFALRLIKHKCFLEKYEITVPDIETDIEDGSDTVKNEKTEEKTGYKMLRGTVVINTNYERQISVDSGRGSLHSEGNAQLPPIKEEFIVEKPKKTNNDFKLVKGYVLQNQDEYQRHAFGEIKNPLTTECKEADDKSISSSDYTTMQELNLSPPDISKQTLKSQQKNGVISNSADIDMNETNFSDQKNHFIKQITPTTTNLNNVEIHSDYTKSNCTFPSNIPDHNDIKSDCTYQSGAMDITYNPYTRSVDGNTCSHDMNTKKCSDHINCNGICQSNSMSHIPIKKRRSMNKMNCSFDMNDTEIIFDDDIIEPNVTDNITRTVNENSYIYSTDVRASSDHINKQLSGYILHSDAEMKGCSDIQVLNIEKKFCREHESENGKKDTLSTEEKINCLPFINTLGVEIQDEDIDDYLLSTSESSLSMHETDNEMSVGFLNEKATNENLPPIENQMIVNNDYVPLHSAIARWNMR